jgi:hypothetical protein
MTDRIPPTEEELHLYSRTLLAGISLSTIDGERLLNEVQRLRALCGEAEFTIRGDFPGTAERLAKAAKGGI